MFKRNSVKILSSIAVAGVLLTACSKTPSTEQASNAQTDHSLEQVKKKMEYYELPFLQMIRRLVM